MRVEYLREFVCLVKSRSFTRTARVCGLAQSTLSKHIAALESEIGFRLFERTSRDVTPTESGKAMFENAVTALELLGRGVERGQSLAGVAGSAVRIGGYLQISSIQNWIYRVETLARGSGSDIRTTLYAPHTTDYAPDSARDDSLDLLARGIIDLAVMEGPREFPQLEEFAHRHIFNEPIVFFAHVDTDLARSSQVQITDLRGHRFVGSLNYPQFQDRVREICFLRGLVPEFGVKLADTFNEFMRSDDPNEVFFLSSSGASRVPDPPASPLAKLRVADEEAYSPVYAVWRKDETSQSMRAFISAIDELSSIHSITE